MKSFSESIVCDTEKALTRTFFAVEATSFEQFILWEQMSPGWSVEIGKLGKSKCLLSLSWAQIQGKLILFWYPCSAISDSRKSEGFLRKNFTKKWDGETRWSVCDAQNFHLCLHAVKPPAQIRANS